MPIGGHPLEQNMALHLRSAAELAQAPDLTAFARWAANGTDLDYLQFVPPLEPSSEPQLVTTA
jgi:hypothetical protein